MKLEEIIESKKIYIAGPCSIESEEHIFRLAKIVKESGANILRGGAYKPRTNPDSFQGLGREALDYLVAAGREYGLPVVSEIVDVRDLDYFKNVDIIQVGARSMQSFALLKELGKLDKYILLKRHMGATIDELIGASRYISERGNHKIILCERGIRSFERATRFSLDLNAVPVIKALTPYRVIVDPSHGTGDSRYVEAMTYAGIGAGADGFIIEVHENPEAALSDGMQTIKPDVLTRIIDRVDKISDILRD